MKARSTVAALFATTVALLTMWAEPARAAEPTCPEGAGVLRHDRSRDVLATTADHGKELHCFYLFTNQPKGSLDHRQLLALWLPATAGSAASPFCKHPSDSLFDAGKAAEVRYRTAGNNLPEARQIAAALLDEVRPLAASCPKSPGDSTDATAHASPPARVPGSKGFDPIIGLAAGGVAGAAAVALTVRHLARKRRRAAAPLADPPSAIYDGDAATLLLVQQGWLAPVARPDGTRGWRPQGDLEQFLHFDHGPWQPAFAPGTIGPDGNAVHELVGVAMTPAADGTIDSLTVVTAVGPPPPPPAPTPAVTAGPAPAPAPPLTSTPDGGGRGMAFVMLDDLINGMYPDRPEPWSPPRPPEPTAPAPAPAPTAPSDPIAAALNAGGGQAVITPGDLHRLAPQYVASDGTLEVHGTPVDALLNGEPVNVRMLGGTLDVDVAMHSAHATFETRDGRIVGHIASLQGPFGGKPLINPSKLEGALQHYLDSRVNVPAAAHGLRVSGVEIGDGVIRLTTAPAPG